MDSKSVKRVCGELNFVSRYDTKIKLWSLTHNSLGGAGHSFTSKQIEKMTPDQLRRKLGAKPSKPKGEPKPRSKFDPAAQITLLVEKNPKREGSAAHHSFALYKTGMTVADFIMAGGKPADLSWDTRKKFISVALPQPQA